MRKLAEVLSENEIEDLQESLMDVLRKANKNEKKKYWQSTSKHY